jgi:hypothetical protein
MELEVSWPVRYGLDVLVFVCAIFVNVGVSDEIPEVFLDERRQSVGLSLKFVPSVLQF